MRYVSYTKNDVYYEFVDENGNKTVFPTVTTVIVDDNSGLLAIKDVASRQTLGYVYK